MARSLRVSLLWFLSILLCLGTTRLALSQQKPEGLAQQSSETWLSLTDSGNYAESYQEAAQYFKDSITNDKWQSAMHAVRDPLGKVLSRNLKSATCTKTLPGAPDGAYVVIQYDTSFEHKQSAVETVTPMLDKDGKWRVSAYFIS